MRIKKNNFRGDDGQLGSWGIIDYGDLGARVIQVRSREKEHN